jgi:hypothetical protein
VNHHRPNSREFAGLALDRSGFTLWPEPDPRKDEPEAAAGTIQSGTSSHHYPHVLNLLECVRSRQKPRSDIETMHRSTRAPMIGVTAT